ncbi:ATP-binding protein [Paenibacillus aestuarii]|uniref:histidine kinase n=1 Tax=Paenibacillus aestuarii TaxID=516965 RepID=A0ABW0K957_9BACL|nr:sensor histidine kinase [Paenibacillus aestuarii]
MLNIFFISIPLLYQLIVNGKYPRSVKHIAYYLIFAIPTILCMSFPIHQENGLLFDFRLIPVILACLYGNSVVALLVGFTLIGTRFVLGGEGFLLGTISTTMTYLVIFFIWKKYHASGLLFKLSAVFAISFFAKLFGKLYYLVGHPDYPHLNNSMAFYAMQSTFLVLMVYMIESIQKNMHLRKEMIESEKLRVASVISASVAHEIRNPLTALRGFIQLLSTTPLSDEKKKRYGEICLEELDRAQQIISDYLSLARPHPEYVEILEVGQEIKYIESILSSYALLRGVQLQIETKHEANIEGDRQKLRQALINIVKNGIEAMEQGGVLELKSQIRDNKTIITVTDTGVGMTVEEINRLGTPYFSNKDKGTGLGTMVSFSIIKNMSGSIAVDSQKGKGTVFTIAFPFVKLVEKMS